MSGRHYLIDESSPDRNIALDFIDAVLLLTLDLEVKTSAAFEFVDARDEVISDERFDYSDSVGDGEFLLHRSRSPLEGHSLCYPFVCDASFGPPIFAWP